MDFVREFKKVISETYSKSRKPGLKISIDREIVKTGDDFENKIKGALENSRMLIPFISANYLESEWCLREFVEFKRLIEEEEKKEKGRIIYPILFFGIDIKGLDSQKNNFNIANQSLFDEMINGLKRLDCISLVFFLRPETENFLKFCENTVKFLIEKIRSIELPATPPKYNNIISIDKNINMISNNIEETMQDFRAGNSSFFDNLRLNLKKKERKYEISPVAVIYTGGTVGMVKVKSGKKDRMSKLITGSVEELISKMKPELVRIEVDIDFYSYKTPLDSSNISSIDWMHLALIIKELYHYYQGFVILHGTGTMSYTASALSFLFENLEKPVILTGAEKPLEEKGNDAIGNTCNAIKTAMHEGYKYTERIPEVCILFGNKILRGNRSKKMVSLSLVDGFNSPNCNPIGLIDDIIEVDKSQIFYSKSENQSHYTQNQLKKLTIHKNLIEDNKNNVLVFDIYPDLPYELYRPILLDKKIEGIILKTYGTGNAPTVPETLLEIVKDALAMNKIIVNVTQCPKGKVEVRLLETNARLFDYGVINGGDMTAEAAFCKLKYLIAKYINKKPIEDKLKRIKQEMLQSLRGELRYSAYSYLYQGPDNKADPVFESNKDYYLVIRKYEQFISAYVRIQGIHLLKNFEDTKQIRLHLYYNRQNIDDIDLKSDKDYEMCIIEVDSDEAKDFIKNIDVTNFLKEKIASRNEVDINLQIFSENDIHIKFDALELTIYTKHINEPEKRR